MIDKFEIEGYQGGYIKGFLDERIIQVSRDLLLACLLIVCMDYSVSTIRS